MLFRGGRLYKGFLTPAHYHAVEEEANRLKCLVWSNRFVSLVAVVKEREEERESVASSLSFCLSAKLMLVVSDVGHEQMKNFIKQFQ